MPKDKKTSNDPNDSNWAPKAARKGTQPKAAPLGKQRTLADLDQLTDIDATRVLKAIIFFDPRCLYREDGTPVAVDELDEATSLALAWIEVEELWDDSFEDGDKRRIQIGNTKKVGTRDKVKAIETYLRTLGKLDGEPEKKESAGLKQLMAVFNKGPVKR